MSFLEVRSEYGPYGNHDYVFRGVGFPFSTKLLRFLVPTKFAEFWRSSHACGNCVLGWEVKNLGVRVFLVHGLCCYCFVSGSDVCDQYVETNSNWSAEYLAIVIPAPNWHRNKFVKLLYYEQTLLGPYCPRPREIIRLVGLYIVVLFRPCDWVYNWDTELSLQLQIVWEQTRSA